MLIQQNNSYIYRGEQMAVRVKTLHQTTRSSTYGPCWEVEIQEGPEAGKTTDIPAAFLSLTD